MNAILVYVSAGQINAIMPSNAPVGLASVRVKTINQQSNAMTEVSEAVNKWRFKPGYRNGQAVAVQATIEVNFRLL